MSIFPRAVLAFFSKRKCYNKRVQELKEEQIIMAEVVKKQDLANALAEEYGISKKMRLHMYKAYLIRLLIH